MANFKMKKGDKAMKVWGLIVVLMVVTSVFGGVAVAENVSEGLTDNATNALILNEMPKTDDIFYENISPSEMGITDEASSGNKDNIISDLEYRDYQSMSLAEIQSWLENPRWGDGYLGRPSYLATYRTTDWQGVERSAAEIIYNAARDYQSQGYQVSPEVILTTLQKEQSLITDPDPSNTQLNWAMGYGPYGQWMGFGAQVDAGGWQLGYNYKYIETHGSKNGWGVGISKQTLDGVTIIPQNIATACLYDYTPHAGAGWGGAGGGNYLFWDLYYNKFHFADGAGPKFNVGDWVQTTVDVGLWVRENPWIDENKIWKAPKGSIGVIIDGPQSGSYTWWKIRYDYAPPTTGYDYWKPSVIGWSAEGDASGDFLEKITPPSLPPKFLTLPFNDPSIKIQQGWVYTWTSDPNAHKGIDYIKGTIDSSSTWQSFDVVAAADGVAMYSTSESYGTFVLIRHNEKDYKGNNYFTLYAHLDSVASGIPYKDKYDVNYATWKPVTRGEFIGRSGNTGASWTGIHLHFEAQRKAYAHYKTDPYDLYKTRSFYPGGGSYTSSGSRYLWTTDPPSLPANNPPQLSNGYVDPPSGDTSTDFYYYVTYFDPDGDDPSVKQVYIDGTPYTMSWYSGLNSHITYRYGPKKLSAVSHNYYFYFEDGRGGSDRRPDSGTYPGPDVYAPPTACFSGSPTSGDKPLTVNFDASCSSGEITSYSWDFGDGNSGSGETPSHTYTSEGWYTVSLTVSGPGGSDTETKTNYIHVTTPALTYIFDTGAGTYPSIFGTHNGTIKPNQTITVFKLYTYPCIGTGGHTEYARIWNNSGLERIAKWGGYTGDWHNITFNKTFVLYKNETYNYTIRTGSYPQIHHTDALPTKNGGINCTKFTDANGKIYTDWIPAIKLWS